MQGPCSRWAAKAPSVRDEAYRRYCRSLFQPAFELLGLPCTVKFVDAPEDKLFRDSVTPFHPRRACHHHHNLDEEEAVEICLAGECCL